MTIASSIELTRQRSDRPRNAVATSAGSRRDPSCSLTSGRRWNCHRAACASRSQEVASSGRSPPAGSGATSVSKTSGRRRARAAASDTSSGIAAGSSVRATACVSTLRVPPYRGLAAAITQPHAITLAAANDRDLKRRISSAARVAGNGRRGRNQATTDHLEQLQRVGVSGGAGAR